MDHPVLWQVADYFFLCLHTLLIVFNMFAWIWKRLRRIHLIVILCTIASWTILGIWYGWGFCPLTEWHWQVLRKLGVYNLPTSYIDYLFQRIIGIRLGPVWADRLTLGTTFLALVLSLKVNFFMKKKLTSD